MKKMDLNQKIAVKAYTAMGANMCILGGIFLSFLMKTRIVLIVAIIGYLGLKMYSKSIWKCDECKSSLPEPNKFDFKTCPKCNTNFVEKPHQ